VGGKGGSFSEREGFGGGGGKDVLGGISSGNVYKDYRHNNRGGKKMGGREGLKREIVRILRLF